MTVQETHETKVHLLPAYEFHLLADRDRQEIEDHVLKCDDCFESLYRFIPIRVGLIEIKKGRADRQVEIVQRSRWQWLMAAIMGLMLIITLWLFRQSTVLQKEIMRGGGQIQLLEPAHESDVKSPVLFRWQEEPEAEFYKLYVFQDENLYVNGERVDLPQYKWIPPENAESGKYQWRVESYFSNASKIRDSITNEFTLRSD